MHHVQHVRPRFVALVQRELQRGKRHAQRVVGPLVGVGRAEERVARVDDRRAPRPALALVLAERDAAPVVDERRVLHQVPEPRARRAQAEVDLLAVTPAEGLLVERAAEIERRARHVHAEPDARDHLGEEVKRALEHERGALVDEWRRALEHEGVDHRLRQRADRSVARKRCDRRDIGKRRRGREPVEPAVGDRRVGVQDHHVARRLPQPAVHGPDEAEVLLVVQHPDRKRRVRRRELIDVLAHRQIG